MRPGKFYVVKLVCLTCYKLYGCRSRFNLCSIYFFYHFARKILCRTAYQSLFFLTHSHSYMRVKPLWIHHVRNLLKYSFIHQFFNCVSVWKFISAEKFPKYRRDVTHDAITRNYRQKIKDAWWLVQFSCEITLGMFTIHYMIYHSLYTTQDTNSRMNRNTVYEYFIFTSIVVIFIVWIVHIEWFSAATLALQFAFIHGMSLDINLWKSRVTNRGFRIPTLKFLVDIGYNCLPYLNVTEVNWGPW